MIAQVGPAQDVFDVIQRIGAGTTGVDMIVIPGIKSRYRFLSNTFAHAVYVAHDHHQVV